VTLKHRFSDVKRRYVITNDLLKFESPITNDYTRTNELVGMNEKYNIEFSMMASYDSYY